ncbi:MAG: BON domain-containing protein [Ferruginibacter sp.]|nr:BON domain-containing protein [Bacteroidota bacterium]MBX2918686.1 BON domain-containing protein [Ferruginibacter sp.]MCB0709546.1 BON domain-containing protein [Chitinophagaceae bacterium]MCC7378078.1 BON domain-containing protein [Chitinophagaceae bacterium]
MKLTKLLMALAVSATVFFVSCKPKDADIKTAVEAALKADTSLKAAMVEVKDGIVTLTGECKDDACKAACEKLVAAVKGVKSVVNNCTVAPPAPVPASVTTVLDAATQQAVKDGLKDIAGVTVEFVGDKAVLKGEVTKANRMKIMQILASAKVLSDVTGLTDKK